MILILREKIHILAKIVQSQLVLSACVRYLLGSKAHAEAGQVAVGEGEEDHEDDVPGVVGEQHGQVDPRRHVAQHEERHEDDAQRHEDRKPDAVLTRLQRDTVTFTTGNNNNNNSVTLLISHRLCKQGAKHVRGCTDHPKCFGAFQNTLKNVKVERVFEDNIAQKKKKNPKVGVRRKREGNHQTGERPRLVMTYYLTCSWSS